MHFMPRLPLLCAVAAFVAGQSLFLLVMPPLARSLGFTDLQAGLIVSLSALLLMISAPFWGHLSDRLGRGPVLSLAIGVSAIALAAIACVIHLRLSGMFSAGVALISISGFRGLQVLLAGGMFPAAQGYIADTTERSDRTRAMGLLGATTGLGGVAGAAVTFGVAPNHPATAFGIVALVLTCALVAVNKIDVPKVQHIKSPENTENLGKAFNISWPYMAITMVSFAGYSILQQVTAIRMQDTLEFTVDVSIARSGAGFLCTAIVMVLTQIVLSRFLTLKPSTLLAAGALISIISVLINISAISYGIIFCSLLILGIGLGLMLPGNMAGLSLDNAPGTQGKAAGLNILAQGIGQTIGPVLASYSYGISRLQPFKISCFLFILALGVALYLSRRSKERHR